MSKCKQSNNDLVHQEKKTRKSGHVMIYDCCGHNPKSPKFANSNGGEAGVWIIGGDSLPISYSEPF